MPEYWDQFEQVDKPKGMEAGGLPDKKGDHDYWSKFKSVENSEPAEKEDKTDWLHSLLSGAGQLGTGVLQGAAKAGRGIGQLETGLVNKLLGTKLKSPEVDLYSPLGVERGTPAKAGEFIGQAGGDIALTSALAPLIGGPLAMGSAGALATEGGAKERGIAGGLGLGLGLGGQLLKKGTKQALLHTSPKTMAKELEKHAANVDKTKSSLYKDVYSGTGGVKPTVTPEAIQNINRALKSKGTTELEDTLKLYGENHSPSKLHDIRKTVGRLSQKLADKEAKSGLSPADRDLKYHLTNKLMPSINDSLERTFNKLSPEKYGQFQKAQNYYKEYKVPLDKYKSIKNLLGSEREISPALKRDLMKQNVTSESLRK